ncbi:hypothetical protein PMZ80_006684 [Knufia obscura]|uniref:Uncharacterized protein n=2 Tax=Knufia TaxID=430999 RepID=A0AAN8E8J5_9EURO|nr:hypothetical protein PMZ80_006684 [Knufia obscura]KAK5948063.1 hypothetical protein OHC33_010904 [Knufia fluminis]
MSPTDSPAQGRKFIPLPKPLPTKDEEERAKKDKKATKEKPKVHVSSHKPSRSYDTGYGSASPYSFEERSPDQYSPSPKSAKPKADTTVYETIDGKARKGTYITKDGKLVRYVSKSPNSPINETYTPTKPADPYKTKYKAAKETTKALQEALTETTEKAQYNYVAAKDQEAKHLSTSYQIDALEEELRKLRLQAQILEGRAAEADRKRMVAERKLREQEIEEELKERREERRLERARREEERVTREAAFARKQWDEIEASPSPISRRPAQKPLIEQDTRPARRSTLVTTSPYSSPYTTQAVTTTTESPGILATSGNPFIDPILEAQRDYDLAQARGEEDRRRATGVQYSSSRRERRRGDDRYK